MPIAKVGNIKMYYEVHGQGEPLLLLNGLGSSARTWLETPPQLSSFFKVIVFDNRGVGRTDKPDMPYSMLQMAQDTAGLLEQLSIDSTHVLGLSMGGYIALELAINYASRVRKLILLSTHAGGPEYFEATTKLWDEILDVEGLTQQERLRRGIMYSMTPEFFHREQELVEQLVAAKMEDAQPAYAFHRQFQAAGKFDARDKLSTIAARTLVITGSQDRVVPLEFSRRLSAGISGAQFKLIEGAGHLLHLERPKEVNASIISFLKGDSP